MIKVENLEKHFGAKRAVAGVTFSVERGEILGFLGPNGAGKSTTMRMITGFIPPTAGKVAVGGHDIVEQPIEAKKLMGYLPENAPSYNDMSVYGFLSFCAELRGLRGDACKKAVHRAVEMCFLESVLHQSTDTLSKGYKHRTCLAQSILHDPAVLILDEPTDGLDPNQKHEARQLIRRMGEKKAIVFSTHILEEVEAVCTRAIIIDRGKIVANGTPAELKQRSDVAGAVSLRVIGVAAETVKVRLSSVPGARKATIVREEAGSVWARAYPAEGSVNGALARNVADATLKEGWKFEELHTEEGRLDEVFRSITWSDTTGSEKKQEENEMNEALRNIKTIAKRELTGFFASPVAYVFIVIWLLLIGFFTFSLGGFFQIGQASLTTPFFRWHPWLYLFLVPAVGMRLWSEERRLHTMELLLTMPITAWQAIVGKFIASWLFLIIALFLTFPVVITVCYLGHADGGEIFAGYVGSALLAGGYLAVTSMTSAMTRNQVISFILSVVICFFLLLAGFEPVTELLPDWLVGITTGLSSLTHFMAFQKGVLDSRDMIYFASLIGFSLFVNGVVIRNQRAG